MVMLGIGAAMNPHKPKPLHVYLSNSMMPAAIGRVKTCVFIFYLLRLFIVLLCAQLREKIMIMGVCLQKNGFQAAFVTGNQLVPVLAGREICTNPESANLPRSASWYENRFIELISAHSPTIVSAKIHYDVKNQLGLINHGFPLGILAQCCHRKGLELDLHTLRKLKGPRNFGLDKDDNTYRWIDALKDTKPYWKDAGRVSTLAAALHLS